MSFTRVIFFGEKYIIPWAVEHTKPTRPYRAAWALMLASSWRIRSSPGKSALHLTTLLNYWPLNYVWFCFWGGTNLVSPCYLMGVQPVTNLWCFTYQLHNGTVYTTRKKVSDIRHKWCFRCFLQFSVIFLFFFVAFLRCFLCKKQTRVFYAAPRGSDSYHTGPQLAGHFLNFLHSTPPSIYGPSWAGTAAPSYVTSSRGEKRTEVRQFLHFAPEVDGSEYLAQDAGVPKQICVDWEAPMKHRQFEYFAHLYLSENHLSRYSRYRCIEKLGKDPLVSPWGRWGWYVLRRWISTSCWRRWSLLMAISVCSFLRADLDFRISSSWRIVPPPSRGSHGSWY